LIIFDLRNQEESLNIPVNEASINLFQQEKVGKFGKLGKLWMIMKISYQKTLKFLKTLFFKER
jgi:hypothetical protein